MIKIYCITSVGIFSIVYVEIKEPPAVLLRYVGHRVRILIDWRILKIAVLNLERLNILESLNILVEYKGWFISNRHFKLKQNITDPLFGNSSLAFIKARELFFNIGGECGAFYSLGLNQGRICYGIGTLCK